MNEIDRSILREIRSRLGPSGAYEVFDTDLIVLINSAFDRLCQLGIGPLSPFRISGENETWDDFIPEENRQALIHDYVYLSVKLIFDPPQNSGALNTFKEQIQKYEYLLKETAQFGY